MQPHAAVLCIICLRNVALATATAGSLYADGSQAFACSAHITERLRWTLAWVAFDAQQLALRQASLEKGTT